MYILENEFLTVKFKSYGAELASLVSRKDQIEFIWQADPSVWPRHAPNLFPIVGKVANNQFTHLGKTYEMGQHGFARDMEFMVESQKANQLVFVLKSTSETKKKYPFEFEFRIVYALEGSTLKTTYHVTNPSNDQIFFSVGAHPAFNIPFGDGGSFSDYFVQFSEKETVGRYLIADGLIRQDKEPILNNEDILPLSKELFLQDALVFKELKSTSMAIKSKKSNHFLRMDFEGFPFFGIWTKAGFDKFLCLEPWCGIADSVGKIGEFKDKEGMNSLESGKTWERSFDITVG